MYFSDSEEEWITVRRRRGGRGGIPKQLQKLAIPVVPLAFDALAEPEEPPAPDATKSKKKKKGKKAKVADGDADNEEAADAAGAAATSASKGAAPAAAESGAKAAASGSKVAQQSLFAWLLSRLVALLTMLGLMRAAGAGKKKRKSKTASAGHKAPEEPKATAAAAAVAAAKPAVELPAKDKTLPANPAAKVAAPQQTQQPPQQQQKPSAAKSASAASAAPVTPAKKQPEASAAKAPETPAAKQGPAAAAASKASAAAETAATPALASASVAAAAAAPAAATPAPAPTPAAEQRKAAPEPPPAPATPAVPPPPKIKYDADWGRGKFVMQSLPGAHADVVSAVALAGDIAVSAGYDGAIKLWHWPSPGSSGGGVAPRLAVGRVLVGHSGRVEALAAHAETRRLVSSGRDSTLKVWDLGSEGSGSGAKELASTYVYESVRTLAADWTGEGGGGAAGRVLLGARSGTVLLYSLGAGGTGRKLGALRGHEDEVTALKFLGGGGGGSQVAVSGSRDGTVRLWDLRTSGGAAIAVLNGLSGRVCSLERLAEHHLVAGDCSSTVKMWDLRQLPPAAPRSSGPPAPPRRLPNAPGFAGDCCPTAGLWQGSRSGVLLSSCIAWWTANKEALEEAPSSAKLPMACLNVAAVGVPTGPGGASAAAAAAEADALQVQYQYTVRLGPGVVTCLDGSADEGAVLAGGATGALWALRLVKGGSAAVAAAQRAAAAAAEADAAAGAGGGCEVVDALVVGAEEFSDDEYEDEDEDDEEGGEDR